MSRHDDRRSDRVLCAVGLRVCAAVPAAFAACGLGCLVMLTLAGGSARAASSVASSLYKTGTDLQTGSQATSEAQGSQPAQIGQANAGDTIKWVLHYSNTSGGPAEVNLTDSIAAGQTFVPGSLRLPPGWAPRFATGLGAPLTHPTEPASGVTAVGGLVAEGDEPYAALTPPQATGATQRGLVTASAARMSVGVTPAASYCDGEEEAHVRAWKEVLLTGVPPGTNTEPRAIAKITLYNENGEIVPGYDAREVTEEEPGGSPGDRVLSIASVPYSAPDKSLRAVVEVEGLSESPVDKLYDSELSVSLTFNGDPVQVCFETKVAPNCTATAGSVTNEGDVITSGIDDVTDEPDGVGSGEARFTVPAESGCGVLTPPVTAPITPPVTPPGTPSPSSTTTTTTTPTTTAATPPPVPHGSGSLTLARVTLVKSSPATVTAGGRITFQLKVSNPGTATLHDVQVCDDLPAGLVYVSSKPKAKLHNGDYCWTVATLNGKASKTFAIVTRALVGAFGKLTNRATASGPEILTAHAHRMITVLRKPTGSGSLKVSSGGVTG
jgi:uncharacterized repeat protein (TIGR01451 family)